VPGVAVLQGDEFYYRAVRAARSFVSLRCTQDDRYHKKDRGKEEKWGGAAAPFLFSLPIKALSS